MSKKTLAIIVLFSIFFTLLLLDISLRSKSLLQSSVPVIQKPVTQEPNINTPIKKEISYQAISIQDDQNSISKLILKDSNQKETLIRQDPYTIGGIDGKTLVKPGYYDFTFSPDNNYFLYSFGIFGGGSNILYNIKNTQSLDLGFGADTVGFTPDSKYIYSCALGGMLPGGGLVKSISNGSNIFASENPCSCNFEPIKNTITISEFSEPDSSSVIKSQYIFSTKTGNLTKIK